MSVESRREREKVKMKNIILSATKEIIKEEGIDHVSIRKIARKIEYSPSIIYHYFKDKEEIIMNVMESGYQKIIMAVSRNQSEELVPIERLVNMTSNYIEAALEMQDEFMAAHLNQSEIALRHTASLFKGASKEKPALSVLYQCLKEMHEGKDCDDDYLEMTAQMIVVSTLGFIMKNIVENNIGEEQRQRLKNFFVNETVVKLAGYHKIN